MDQLMAMRAFTRVVETGSLYPRGGLAEHAHRHAEQAGEIA